MVDKEEGHHTPTKLPPHSHLKETLAALLTFGELNQHQVLQKAHKCRSAFPRRGTGNAEELYKRPYVADGQGDWTIVRHNSHQELGEERATREAQLHEQHRVP